MPALSFALLEAFDKQLLESATRQHEPPPVPDIDTAQTGPRRITGRRESQRVSGRKSASVLSLAERRQVKVASIPDTSVSGVKRSPAASPLRTATPTRHLATGRKQSTMLLTKNPAASAQELDNLPLPSSPSSHSPRSVHFAPEMVVAAPSSVNPPSHRAASPIRSALKSPVGREASSVAIGVEGVVRLDLAAGDAEAASPEPNHPVTILPESGPRVTMLDAVDVEEQSQHSMPGETSRGDEDHAPVSTWDRLAQRTPHYYARIQQLKEEKELAFSRTYTFSPKLNEKAVKLHKQSADGKTTSSSNGPSSTQRAARRNSSIISTDAPPTPMHPSAAATPFHRDPLLEGAHNFDDTEDMYDDIEAGSEDLGRRASRNYSQSTADVRSGRKHSSVASFRHTGRNGSVYSRTSSVYDPPPSEESFRHHSSARHLSSLSKKSQSSVGALERKRTLTRTETEASLAEFRKTSQLSSRSAADDRLQRRGSTAAVNMERVPSSTLTPKKHSTPDGISKARKSFRNSPPRPSGASTPEKSDRRHLSDLYVWDASRKEKLAALAEKLRAEREKASAEKEDAWRAVTPVTMSPGSRRLIQGMHDRRISAVDHAQMVSAARAREASTAAAKRRSFTPPAAMKQQQQQRHAADFGGANGPSSDVPIQSNKKDVARLAANTAAASMMEWWMESVHNDASYIRNR